MFVCLDLRKHAEDLVDKARMAPSLHNAQPWAFRIKSNAVEIYLDHSRDVPVLDPAGRQMLIGVGAAVFTIRLGISLLGATPTTALLPGPERGELAASVTLGPEHLPAMEEARLMQQVPLRRTIRDRFDPQVPAKVREELTAEATEETATLTWVTDPAQRTELAHLVALAERREQADPRIQEELARWVGGRTVRYGSGIPEEALGPSGESGREEFQQRDFAGGRPRFSPASVEQEMEPTIAVLTTDGDRPVDWLRAGQALMRVLLTATAHGLAASYLNQPLELPDLRPRVRETLALVGFPQLILRLGRPIGGWPLPTPRRPVADLLRP
ncbi:Acg family FMN-binding oxidoreductase [Actinopolymorpha alba]|uniref:Acg family FMN-binding oxidoreductase n=1 Tax=Actinopolymorpha alba TaxID=533267 RepID=UPI000382D05F|nr:hypothetical protein [Actinopolymorpha alba]